MKLVEGQLELMRMFRGMSSLSDSYTSKMFRDYIDILDRAVANGFGDILPRTANVKPMIGEDGKVSSNWISPEVGSGRIVSKSS